MYLPGRGNRRDFHHLWVDQRKTIGSSTIVETTTLSRGHGVVDVVERKIVEQRQIPWTVDKETRRQAQLGRT